MEMSSEHPSGVQKPTFRYQWWLFLIPCKNDIGPEAGTKDVFKQLDHAFQTMGEPRTLPQKKRMTLGCLPVKYLSIEKNDKGADMLDILLQLLHQLLHSLPVSLHLVSKAWIKLVASIAFILPGVSITVTGFPPSPFHLIYPFIENWKSFCLIANLPASAQVFWVTPWVPSPATKHWLPSEFSSSLKLWARPRSTFPKLDLPEPVFSKFVHVSIECWWNIIDHLRFESYIIWRRKKYIIWGIPQLNWMVIW